MASCALLLCRLFIIFTLSTVLPANCKPSWGKHTVLLNRLMRRDRALEPEMVKPGVRRESAGAIFLELKKLRHWNQKSQNRALELDAARVLFLQNILRANDGQGTLVDSSEETRIPLTSGRKLGSLNYVVRIGIGKQEMTVLVDTGSDLTWVQCSPCTDCYQQMDSLYSPSSSYIPIPCNSSTCGSLQISAGCASATATAGTCAYDVSYGDGSSTHGDIATDTLTLGTDTIGGFVFGCGHKNRGLFGGAAGLLGLGRSSPSLIFQAFDRYNGVFSYCLPSSQGTTGSLVLGDPSSTSGYNSTAFIYASMIQNPQIKTYYLLNLTGVSVGGVYISAPSTLGTASSSSTLIDSGTVITRLGPSLYKAVSNEFVKQAIGFPPAPSFSILDTCFNLSGFPVVNIPTLQFHLGSSHGASGSDVQVNVDSSGILYVVNSDASQACLALAGLQSESEYQIIGNYQQQNLRITYDVKESKVGFAPETCR